LPEWLIERGIGEVREALVEGGKILEARIAVEGVISVGTIIKAKLIDVGRNGRNAVAEAEGQEYLLRGTPTGISEGATFDLEVTRSKIPGTEPWKRPLGRAANPLQVENESPRSSAAMPPRISLAWRAGMT